MLFFMVCSFIVFVSNFIHDNMMLPYSSVALVIAVYVFSNVSFDLPQ